MKKLSLCLLLSLFSGVAAAETPVEHYFNQIQGNPQLLREFLAEMPKGGDIHSHLTGASYAEYMINDAHNPSLCLSNQDVLYLNSHCAPNRRLMSVAGNPVLYSQVLNAWSFINPKNDSAKHFFDTFADFDLLSPYRVPMLEEVINRAATENISYLELMISPPDESQIANLGSKISYSDDYAAMEKQLIALGINHYASDMSQQVTQYITEANTYFACATPNPKPGCSVTYRLQVAPFRLLPPNQLFADLMAAFMLANQNPQVVGVNLVGEEDAPEAYETYDAQMQMVRYFHQQYPQVKISLHAGEMAFGKVPPEYLYNGHIGKAVNIAGADRIGHGLDIVYEQNHRETLATMRSKAIPVEIALTSNQEIWGVQSSEIPILYYLQNGVPVVLATDDEGVLRTDLTNEYQKAVTEYHFTYPQLKNFARNSLYFSFLPGMPLWTNDTYQAYQPACADLKVNVPISASCQSFLQESPKAQIEWNLEERFASFEQNIAKLNPSP